MIIYSFSYKNGNNADEVCDSVGKCQVQQQLLQQFSLIA